MQPLIDLAAQPGGWPQVIERYDEYSLLGWLMERGVSEQALWLLGPLFNLEGRFHFSLVEWFTHWHEDVFGDLEFIDAGADTLPAAFAPALLERHAASVRRSTRSTRAPRASSCATATRVGNEGVVEGDECILTVPFVLLRHMEINGLDIEKWFAIRNVYYGRAHKIFMQFSRPLVEPGLRDHPRRDRHGPGDPERGLHAGRPGPVDRARA